MLREISKTNNEQNETVNKTRTVAKPFLYLLAMYLLIEESQIEGKTMEPFEELKCLSSDRIHTEED